MLLQLNEDFALLFNEVTMSEGEVVDSLAILLDELLFAQVDFVLL